MSLYEEIISIFPELENSPEFLFGSIKIENSGNGDQIVKWQYEKALPKSLQAFLVKNDEVNEL